MFIGNALLFQNVLFLGEGLGYEAGDDNDLDEALPTASLSLNYIYLQVLPIIIYACIRQMHDINSKKMWEALTLNRRNSLSGG